MTTPTEKHLEKAREIVHKAHIMNFPDLTKMREVAVHFIEDEFAKALSAQRTEFEQKLAERDAEIERLKNEVDHHVGCFIKAKDEANVANRKLSVAVEALKPFAKAFSVRANLSDDPELQEFLDSNTITPSMKNRDFRRAYEALASGGEQ